MKVLFVCSGNFWFGINPMIKSQGNSLIKHGINVEYFLVKGRGIIGYFKNIKPLRKKIKTNNYDIIHSHYAFNGWLAVLTFTFKPIVVSYMGGDTYGYVNEKGHRILKSYIEIITAILLQPFVKKIIAKSKNIEKYIYLKKKSIIIPNGVDFNLFKFYVDHDFKKELHLKEERKYILFLGNKNDPRKNFRLLAESFNKINNKDFEIINPYPIKHDDVVKYLNACDVLAFPSYLEGSPNVIKEAMACNIPIVSTDVGDIREVIRNTEGCYIVLFDVQDFSSKIKLALKFNKRTNGQENILHLNDNKIAEEIISVYEKVNKL